MELIRPIVKVGNSAGVVLPKSWYGGQARVELIVKPVNIKRDIFEILESYLHDVLGIYLVGSYARGEQTGISDIDVLVITKESNRKIRKGRYEIILISRDNLDRAMKDNIMPLLPMIKEAKPVLNEGLINEYKNINPNKRNLRWITEITKSSKKVNEQAIKISKELKENISDGIMYSIILGLRSTYTINCLKNNKIPTKKGLMYLLRKMVKTEEPYNAYLRSKNNRPEKQSIPSGIAEKLNNMI